MREVEQRLRVADRLAACIVDPRAPDQITHSLADIIRFRLLMIAAGYEDGNDANSLRCDPMFKMALDLTPSDRELCSQSTISRLENLPDARALLRMGRAMVDLYCESFARFPSGSRWISTTRSTRFMAASNCGCSMPITTNTAFSRLSCSTARAASSLPCCVPPNGRAAGRSAPSCAACCARSAPTGRTPRFCCAPTAIIAVPRFSIGVAPTGSTTSWASRRPRRCDAISRALKPARKRASRRAEDGKARRFKEFYDGAAELEPRRADHRPRRSRRGRTRHAIHRHQSATSATPVPSTKTSTAGAARLKTTSNPGRRISRRTARPARRRRPTSSGCSCTPAPIG